VGRLREVAAPFVAAAPAGARVRARLRCRLRMRRCCGLPGRTWGRWLAVTWRPGARKGAPGRAAPGGQAPRPAGSPGEPSLRTVPAVAPGGVHLPGRRGGRPGRHRGRQVRHRVRAGIRALVRRRQLEDRAGAGPGLGELRAHPVVAVDVNAGHLAVAVLTPDGNVAGVPFTVPLELAGLPAATSDGRLRNAISVIIATAREHGARAIAVEDLDFASARAEGRERTGGRPSRGKRGRGFRRAVAGIPTARFRGRLVQMTANAGLPVIVADPAYTSRWGAQHWLAPLREHHPKATGHHAAALVAGRRGLGHRARRRATGNHAAPEEAARPAQARPRKNPAAGPAPRKPATPRGPRQPPGTKTRQPHRTTAGDQAAQHRPGPPDTQDHLLLSRLGAARFE
jgi:hypothetical protein